MGRSGASSFSKGRVPRERERERVTRVAGVNAALVSLDLRENAFADGAGGRASARRLVSTCRSARVLCGERRVLLRPVGSQLDAKVVLWLAWISRQALGVAALRNRSLASLNGIELSRATVSRRTGRNLRFYVRFSRGLETVSGFGRIEGVLERHRTRARVRLNDRKVRSGLETTK